MKNLKICRLKLTNRTVLFLVIIFLVLTVLSTIILFDRLGIFTGNTPSTVVSIASTASTPKETQNVSSSVRTVKTESIPDTVTAFTARDDVTVWNTNTEIDIFKSSYDNGEGKITVVGNGDKLLAPGTEYQYDFYVENNGTYAVDYTITGAAIYSHNDDYVIPVSIKLVDNDGVYLMGTETSWTPVASLNLLNRTRTLGANCFTKYTLLWKWPFEKGVDDYDTMLGNAAVEDDIYLTVKLNTTAELNTNPNAQGGEGIGSNPKTGDTFPVILWTVVMSVSFVSAFVVAVVYFKKRRESQNESES